MACDIRIAKSGGGKIGLPEVNLGVLPGTGGTQRLGRLLGKSKAIELMVEGRTFGFEEALQLGLINKIYEAEDFFGAVMDYARQFVPPNKASRAVGRIKRAVCSGVEVPFSEGLAIERELQQLLFQGSDAREGLNAYIEKRPPEFTGT
jgi:enoyl-CoA hydratase/carnithine racemase